MIRLVHQFDTPKTRPVAAAPKSGGCCCCCCCCLVTIAGACVITARAVGSAPARRRSLPTPVFETRLELAPPNEGEGGGLYRPEPRVVEVPVLVRPAEEPMPQFRTPIRWRVFGFFLLPLAMAIGVPVMFLSPAMGLACIAASFVGGLLYLHEKIGFHAGVLIALIVGIPILSVVEAFIWIGLM